MQIAAVADTLGEYKNARSRLRTFLADPDTDKTFLSDKPWTHCVAFAMYYRVHILRDEENSVQIAVTKDMLERWGISADQLHKDALEATQAADEVFLQNETLYLEYTEGSTQNLLNAPCLTIGPGFADLHLYELSLLRKFGGASVIGWDGVLDRTARYLGNSFYLLAPSVNYCLVISASIATRRSAQSMLEKGIAGIVPEKERLSTKLHYYDRLLQCSATCR